MAMMVLSPGNVGRLGTVGTSGTRFFIAIFYTACVTTQVGLLSTA